MVQRYDFLGRRKNLPLSLCGHAGLCGLPRKNPGAPKWDYSMLMCQRNAEAEGLADRCDFQKGDANNLDFVDGTFDAVVSNFVYHKISDGKSREELLLETLRVLKPGGSFALQDIFGKRSVYGDFMKTVQKLGTNTVSEINYADSASEIPIPKWMPVTGILPGVGIIYGRK